MKKALVVISNVLLVLGLTVGASAWIYVPDKGDTGWQTYTYTAGPGGFTGSVGFVVSNVIDNSAYPELLLDNLSQGGGGTNRGFELGLFSGYNFLGNSGACADLYSSRTSALGTVYKPTEGDLMAELMGLSTGVNTSGFQNATSQAGTVGAIMETDLSLGAGQQFSFDWAFLANDLSPWDDFALFYLKDQNGIVFSAGLAQIGSAPIAAPINSSFLLLGSGLLGLLGLTRKGKGKV